VLNNYIGSSYIILCIIIFVLAQYSQQNREENQDEYNMTLNNTSTSNEPTEPIAFGTKINKKKKFSSEIFLGKACSVLSENEDDLDVFGKFVTSELRGLQAEHLKKKLNVKLKNSVGHCRGR